VPAAKLAKIPGDGSCTQALNALAIGKAGGGARGAGALEPNRIATAPVDQGMARHTTG